MNIFLEFLTKYKSKYYLEISDRLLQLLSFAISVTSFTTKFRFLSFIQDNIFLEDSMKQENLDIFGKVQKIYHGFSKLAIIFKYKNAKIHNITDLSMTPFIHIKNVNLFNLLQNNLIYLFTRRDLICLLNSALSFSPFLFLEPLISKNPYTNVLFTKTNLYNIY